MAIWGNFFMIFPKRRRLPPPFSFFSAGAAGLICFRASWRMRSVRRKTSMGSSAGGASSRTGGGPSGSGGMSASVGMGGRSSGISGGSGAVCSGAGSWGSGAQKRSSIRRRP